MHGWKPINKVVGLAVFLVLPKCSRFLQYPLHGLGALFSLQLWGFVEDKQIPDGSMVPYGISIHLHEKPPKLPCFVGSFQAILIEHLGMRCTSVCALAPRVTMEAAMAMATERLFNKAPFVNVQVAVGAASSKDVNKNSTKFWHGKNMWGWFTGTMILTCFEFVWMGFHSIKIKMPHS